MFLLSIHWSVDLDLQALKARVKICRPRGGNKNNYHISLVTQNINLKYDLIWLMN